MTSLQPAFPAGELNKEQQFWVKLLFWEYAESEMLKIILRDEKFREEGRDGFNEYNLPIDDGFYALGWLLGYSMQQVVDLLNNGDESSALKPRLYRNHSTGSATWRVATEVANIALDDPPVRRTVFVLVRTEG